MHNRHRPTEKSTHNSHTEAAVIEGAQQTGPTLLQPHAGAASAAPPRSPVSLASKATPPAAQLQRSGLDVAAARGAMRTAGQQRQRRHAARCASGRSRQCCSPCAAAIISSFHML